MLREAMWGSTRLFWGARQPTVPPRGPRRPRGDAPFSPYLRKRYTAIFAGPFGFASPASGCVALLPFFASVMSACLLWLIVAGRTAPAASM